MMRRCSVVVSLERRREQKELAKVYDCIRRLVSVPDYLIEDVLGIDPEWDRDEHDDAMTAERLARATGQQWPAPGLAERTVRAIKRGR